MKLKMRMEMRMKMIFVLYRETNVDFYDDHEKVYLFLFKN
jgi:hypothetical protein